MITPGGRIDNSCLWGYFENYGGYEGKSVKWRHSIFYSTWECITIITGSNWQVFQIRSEN